MGIKITITFDDNLNPKQKIENKIELISGLFYTKINFNDESLQITFDENDFTNYLNGNRITENPYFDSNIKYDEDDYQHMIEYRNINKIKQQKCSTTKQFEYIDNVDVNERKNKMVDELKVYDKEKDHTFI